MAKLNSKKQKNFAFTKKKSFVESTPQFQKVLETLLQINVYLLRRQKRAKKVVTYYLNGTFGEIDKNVLWIVRTFLIEQNFPFIHVFLPAKFLFAKKKHFRKTHCQNEGDVPQGVYSSDSQPLVRENQLDQTWPTCGPRKFFEALASAKLQTYQLVL